MYYNFLKCEGFIYFNKRELKLEGGKPPKGYVNNRDADLF